MNKEMSYSELKFNIMEFLKSNKFGALATSMNNIPRSSPVQYFLGENMDIYILSSGGDKFNAIVSNRNVCLLVNTEYVDHKRIKGVQVFGEATICKQDKKVFEEAIKYCPDKSLVEEAKESMQAIKIIPKEVVYLDALKDGDRTKQILKVEDETVVFQEPFVMEMSLS